MSLLPFFDQLILPTVLSLYMSLSTFFPIHPIQKIDIRHTTEKVKVTIKKPEDADHSAQAVKKNDQKEDTEQHDSQQAAENHSTITNNASDKENNNISPSTPTPTSASNNSQLTSNTQSVSKTVTAITTITASGKTIHLSMSYPSSGGAVSGKITGDCTGTISGNYDGPSTAAFIGTGSATCPVGFISVPVNINFTGKLLSSSQATINYIVSAMGQTQAGTTTVNLLE